jgi:hypothetical protein
MKSYALDERTPQETIRPRVLVSDQQLKSAVGTHNLGMDSNVTGWYLNWG